MIIGIGTDIIDIRRIEAAFKRHGTKFASRVFTAAEQKNAARIKDIKKRYSYYAKRFAAKEAIAKALGTGIGKGVLFKDISITNAASGAPIATLTGKGKKTLSTHSKRAAIHLSLSDDYPIAQAFAVIDDCQKG